jgi:hypothetical protein
VVYSGTGGKGRDEEHKNEKWENIYIIKKLYYT